MDDKKCDFLADTSSTINKLRSTSLLWREEGGFKRGFDPVFFTLGAW